MKIRSYIQQRLGWKLFLSYLIVILVGVMSLLLVAQWQAPSALARHASRMESMMGGNSSMMADLTTSFQEAVSEILWIAAVASALTAVMVSSFVTMRIVEPVRAMKLASQRIAAGQYGERVTVTEQDELGALAVSFNQMAHTLEDTETRRRQLIGDVAHELRTPLSSIRSVLEGMVDGVLPAEIATFQDMQKEVRRLQCLVFDLEELSRAEAGQISLERKRVTPNALVTGVVNRLLSQFEDKGVLLRWEVGEKMPALNIDEARMTQVFINLLGNALQYTPAGETVWLKVEKKGDSVVFVVKDAGIGIALEHLPLIFERFYRVDKARTRARGGNGIGLTISKHLVEAHGGTIQASSAGLGQGSAFTVRMPIS
jgi:histidine kinase